MNNRKPSFFERLTGSMRLTPEDFESTPVKTNKSSQKPLASRHEYTDDEETVYESVTKKSTPEKYDN